MLAGPSIICYSFNSTTIFYNKQWKIYYHNSENRTHVQSRSIVLYTMNESESVELIFWANVVYTNNFLVHSKLWQDLFIDWPWQDMYSKKWSFFSYYVNTVDWKEWEESICTGMALQIVPANSLGERAWSQQKSLRAELVIILPCVYRSLPCTHRENQNWRLLRLI